MTPKTYKTRPNSTNWQKPPKTKKALRKNAKSFSSALLQAFPPCRRSTQHLDDYRL